MLAHDRNCHYLAKRCVRNLALVGVVATVAIQHVGSGSEIDREKSGSAKARHQQAGLHDEVVAEGIGVDNTIGELGSAS